MRIESWLAELLLDHSNELGFLFRAQTVFVAEFLSYRAIVFSLVNFQFG